MSVTPRHREAEARFRELLEAAELPGPDEVGYEPESVVFYWNEPKVAVVVDFDEESAPSSNSSSRADHAPR